MAARESCLIEVKAAATEASLLFSAMDLNNEERKKIEKQIAERVLNAELALEQPNTLAQQERERDNAVQMIVLISLSTMQSRLAILSEQLRKIDLSRPTPEMIPGLNLARSKLLLIGKQLNAATLISEAYIIRDMRGIALGSCVEVSGMLNACEGSIRRMRSWSGTKKDWFVAIAAGIIVGIILLPITIAGTDWWEHHESASAKSLADRHTTKTN